MDTDPAASMRIWAVEFDLGGRTYEVPALPAADWWPLLVRGDVLDVLDLIQDQDQDQADDNEPDLDEMILTGQLTAEELTQTLTQVVEQVAGRSLYATMLLVQAAQLIWPTVGGELARRGFRWDQAPLGAALDALYVTIMERLKTEGARQFQAALDADMPPPTASRGPGRRRKASSKAMADFGEMAGPKPPPVIATAGQSASGRPRTRPRPPQRPQGAQ